MPKSKKGSEPEFSREREFTVVLEDLRSQFRVFGEEQSAIKEDLHTVKEKVGQLVEDMFVVKTKLDQCATKKDLEVFDKRLTALETR